VGLHGGKEGVASEVGLIKLPQPRLFKFLPDGSGGNRQSTYSSSFHFHMIRINENYLKLKASYLFADIASRVKAFTEANPDKPLIRLGIGDVTEPLPEVCVKALHEGADELSRRETFRGYGPEQGYAFLREAIAAGDYADCPISADEIFVSDGAKCDSANIQEIFAEDDLKLAIPDPVYPVYIDTNVMAGRTGENVDDRYQGVTYLECTPENGYVPAIPDHPTDLIYLCFPNNPTGAMATKEQLQAWVDYAKANRAIILYDVAYVAFIRDESAPKSIYEIPGADEVAIEMRSFSKTAGFTGTRCAYTVVPKKLQAQDSAGNSHSVHGLWNRRQATKFNGVSYPVQKAAAAIYTEEGQAQVKEKTDMYLENAAIIREAITKLGLSCVGGDNAPYIWINTGTDSWAFFDRLLNEAGVVCTPGAGFGTCGEGHVRISAFNSRENVENAMARIAKALA
jgi:LL-diaminopimelate aminotransferase